MTLWVHRRALWVHRRALWVHRRALHRVTVRVHGGTLHRVAKGTRSKREVSRRHDDLDITIASHSTIRTRHQPLFPIFGKTESFIGSIHLIVRVIIKSIQKVSIISIVSTYLRVISD
jgi:hypothetical protein